MKTGRDNADQFVHIVLKDDSRIIIKYGDSWPWMCNKEWREYVMRYLKGSPFKYKKMYFSPPSVLDGWTFVAYREGSELPISIRSLDDEA